MGKKEKKSKKLEQDVEETEETDCQTNEGIDFDATMANITIDIDNLKSTNNLEKILKKRTAIQENIKNATEKLQKIKTTICEKNDTNKSDQSANDLDGFDLSKQCKLIDKLTESFWENKSLEEQIQKYNEICQKIDECVKFLEIKKLEIVHVE